MTYYFIVGLIPYIILKVFVDPMNNERHCLGAITQNYPSCMALIVDGILAEIRRMCKNALHSKWFKMEEKLYCVNNTMIVRNDGLFMHIDVGYPGSFHNCTF